MSAHGELVEPWASASFADAFEKSEFRIQNSEFGEAECPLKPMTEAERLVADYAGMGLTAGRHPMALRRDELAMRGILRATDLPSARKSRSRWKTGILRQG